MSSGGVRGFDPAAVKYGHIRPVTILYGDDPAGISLRASRFAELMSAEDPEAVLFHELEPAIGYLASGSMFSPSVHVVVENASPALKSSADARNALRELYAAIATYDETDSKIVVCFPVDGQPKPLSDFLAAARDKGWMVRQVSAPRGVRGDAVSWAVEHAKSVGRKLSAGAAEKLLSACAGDKDAVAKLVENVPEVEELAASGELAQWVGAVDEARPYDIMPALRKRDVAALKEKRETFPAGSSGYRMFLVKMRYVMPELVAGELGKATSPGLAPGWAVQVYDLVNLEVARLNGAGRPASETAFFARLSAIDRAI